jgi:uncharacterized membrane protein
MQDAATSSALEATVGHWLRVVGLGIEVFAAVVIVSGLAWSTFLFLRRHMAEAHYEAYKIRIGRSLLLGLEVVVAADIVKTIAVAPTLTSLAVLAGLVLIRTFLSWTLVLEIDGRWPWQRERAEAGSDLGSDPPAPSPTANRRTRRV